VRILVTGTNGQVGGAILAALSGHRSVLPAPREVLDLANPEEIAGRLDDLKPDIVINPAAYTAVDRAEDEHELAFRVNAAAPRAIASWAAHHAVPLIHFSTDYVFDGSGNRAWREDDRTGPLNIYGASKLEGEKAVRAARGPHLIIRTSWVYAVHGTNFLRTIARLARERDVLRIVADQIGSPTSAALIAGTVVQILNAGDLVDAFARARSCVHVTARGETSWHGFAQAIVAGLKSRGAKIKTERIEAIATADYPTKAQRPLNSRLSLGRLVDVFNVKTADWQMALAPELDILAQEPNAAD
jgi:dTDP-4-dehydrorhamnose reductase